MSARHLDISFAHGHIGPVPLGGIPGVFIRTLIRDHRDPLRVILSHNGIPTAARDIPFALKAGLIKDFPLSEPSPRTYI